MFDLSKSFSDAERRLGDHLSDREPERRRGPRSDRGKSRLADSLAALRELSLGYDRPEMKEFLAVLSRRCRELGLVCPSRALVYTWLPRIDGHVYLPSKLPPLVRETLYNLSDDGPVPGRQLAFHCFNYGSVEAVCFAAGLPWLDLYQASYLRGFRTKSRGLLEAVCRIRRI